MKIDKAKLLSIAGLLLSVVGTIASGAASDHKMKDAVAKAVDEKLKNI